MADARRPAPRCASRAPAWCRAGSSPRTGAAAASPSRRRHCRSARRRAAGSAGRSPRGRWRRAAAGRPTSVAGRASSWSASPTQSSSSLTCALDARLGDAGDAQRQRDVVEGGEMIDQAEILEHDADPAPQRRQLRRAAGARRPGRTARSGRATAARRDRSAQQARLAGAARPGEKMERAGGELQGDVAQHLGPRAVAHGDILEAHQASISLRRAARWHAATAQRRPAQLGRE